MVNFDWKLCAETWSGLEIDKLGVQVYITMFQMDPNMRKLFSFKDDVLEESMGLKRHSGILMRTIETSLAASENMEKFVPYLTSLAQRHAQYGLKPGYFNVLGKSLLLTIENALGSKWTDEVKQAWNSFWSTMESILTPALLHAINKPETMKGMYASPVRSGSKGNVIGKGEERKTSTTQNSNLVLTTWSIVEKDPDQTGMRVFIHFFKLCPDTLQLFSFKEEAPLEESPGLRRHAGIFIRTLGQAVAGLENLTSMLPYLRSLAARHVQYGVTSELITAMGNAVFLAMEEVLLEEWSADVQEAWALAWAAVESAMCDAVDEVRRGKGELPQLPVYDEAAEAEAEEKGSPLASIQQDFYKQIGINKAAGGALTPVSKAKKEAQHPKHTHLQPTPEAPSSAEAGPGEPPSLEEEEEELDEEEQQQALQNETFTRMRSAPSRKETMAMLPSNLRMVHQEINGLMPARPDDGMSETSSAAGSLPGDVKRAFPWQEGSFKNPEQDLTGLEDGEQAEQEQPPTDDRAEQEQTEQEQTEQPAEKEPAEQPQSSEGAPASEQPAVDGAAAKKERKKSQFGGCAVQ